MRAQAHHCAGLALVVGAGVAVGAGRPARADQKPDFAAAICNFVGGQDIAEKVRGLYYNDCICNEVDRTIARSSSAGNMWAQATKLEGQTVPISCMERKLQDDKIVYE